MKGGELGVVKRERREKEVSEEVGRGMVTRERRNRCDEEGESKEA